MKLPGWEGRLTAYLEGIARSPFKPGQLDCALFFDGAVEAMTGKSHAKGMRGKYRTLERGKAMLRKDGFADHIEYAASILETLPSVLFAQRGDGAVVGEALGVVQGDRIYVMRLDGLAIVPLDQASKAFRV